MHWFQQAQSGSSSFLFHFLSVPSSPLFVTLATWSALFEVQTDHCFYSLNMRDLDSSTTETFLIRRLWKDGVLIRLAAALLHPPSASLYYSLISREFMAAHWMGIPRNGKCVPSSCQTVSTIRLLVYHYMGTRVRNGHNITSVISTV